MGYKYNRAPLGIGFSELAEFQAAVMKKGDLENISYDRAAYALMVGIDTSDKLIQARKQLNDTHTLIQIQLVNLDSARQTDAINALMKLQAFGVTIEEILNIYGILNSARLETAGMIQFEPILGAPN